MNAVRIQPSRTELLPGEALVTFTWANPKPPKSIPDPSAKYVKLQEQLNKDPRRFKSRCEFAGL